MVNMIKFSNRNQYFTSQNNPQKGEKHLENHFKLLLQCVVWIHWRVKSQINFENFFTYLSITLPTNLNKKTFFVCTIFVPYFSKLKSRRLNKLSIPLCRGISPVHQACCPCIEADLPIWSEKVKKKFKTPNHELQKAIFQINWKWVALESGILSFTYENALEKRGIWCKLTTFRFLGNCKCT